MEVVELRTLDGPNMFLLKPAIKVELVARSDEESQAPRRFAARRKSTFGAPTHGPIAIANDLASVVETLHAELDLSVDAIAVRELEEGGHVAVAFTWHRRRAGKAIGNLAWKIVAGDAGGVDVNAELDDIRALLATLPDRDDVPEVYPEKRRTVPTIGITGTNGKTTTTRLVSSIMRHAGYRVGWTSSSGVMIDDETVLEGDYTGPAGAARVFEEPGLDFAVLETARGGILLRGLGYEHNDVSVMTNVSADHMGMHGVHSLDVLAEVKAVVARVTTTDGFAVLNADDPRVLGVRRAVSCRPFLFTRHPDNVAVGSHIAANGWALVSNGTEIHWHQDGNEELLVSLADVPMTFSGRAAHMVENAMAAAGACLAVGMAADDVRAGLFAFRNRPDQNRGRLNVYSFDGATVVIDFAHNEAGLHQLLQFGRSLCDPDGRLIVVIGTAGDRGDEAIRGIGEIAAAQADGVIVKDSEKYLRGRLPGEMPAILRQSVGSRLLADSANERMAFYTGIDMLSQGDVLAVMCIEDYDEILSHLDHNAIALS